MRNEEIADKMRNQSYSRIFLHPALYPPIGVRNKGHLRRAEVFALFLAKKSVRRKLTLATKMRDGKGSSWVRQPRVLYLEWDRCFLVIVIDDNEADPRPFQALTADDSLGAVGFG